MTTRPTPWRLSAVLLALAGLFVCGIGAFFVFLRPPLPPEDVRYMQLSATEFVAVGHRLEVWLNQVFRVLGGYALATGLLTVALAATAFRARHPVAVIGALTGGAASIGSMAIVNFAIDSDFKWFLLGPALVWTLSMVAYWAEGWTARAPTRSTR